MMLVRDAEGRGAARGAVSRWPHPCFRPNLRLDAFVDRAPDGVRHRLTTYTGQILCGSRTTVLGAQAGGSIATFEHAWLLPDSLPYRAARLSCPAVVRRASCKRPSPPSR